MFPAVLRSIVGLTIVLGACGVASAQTVEPWRVELYENWKALPVPPITPYDGPFGNSARGFTVTDQAFIGANRDNLSPEQIANLSAINDYRKTAANGVYNPKHDPRPINHEYEKAILEDWHRMGYNTAYKGGSFTFMVGSYLKEQGLLGAIDQTLWGAGGPPPLQFDGKEGSRQREACGSFFDPENFKAGVDAITGMGHFYGHHLFTVGDHKLTCSWDEVGLRTRAQMDYREPMPDEFRKFLKDIWFQDAAPNKDTNNDGRTYNKLTGENLTSWDQVEPMHVSLNWTMPAWKDGGQVFSAMPEVDGRIFEQPGRYKLLVDFHRYYTFEFFRRINEQATANMNRLGTPGRVSVYPFTQHFIIWPGANQRHGNSFYWYHRISPVVNVEHCWPDSPTMNLNFAITDRLAPKYKNAVMAWPWFYFGQEGHDMYNGPHDASRAMARIMGHNVDGTHHWLYSPRYRGRDTHIRSQIAYWQNFLGHHYAGFLSKSAPVKPQVALMMSDYTGYFYRYFQYPKQDWGWTAEAFQNLQYQFNIITEEELELEDGTLDDYKVLYVIGSEWTTPTIRRRIEDFIAKGGIVFTNVDSLSLDIASGKRTDFLEKTFGVKIDTKHKNAFYPSTQTVEEAVWALQFDRWGGPFKLQGHMVHELDDPRAWAKLYKRTEEKYLTDEAGNRVYPIPPNQGMRGGQPMRDPSWKMIRDADGNLVRDEAVWQQLDEAMAQMPRQVHGIRQAPLDMRTPPEVRYAQDVTAAAPAVQWSEVATATAVKGEPIAWWGEKVVGIETDSTVWLGTREGMNIHAISSRMSAHRGTEPVNPFPSEIPELYESHRPYAEALGYAARKAGVTRPVALTLDGRVPMNLEVLPRVAADGTMMVIVINHDKTEATYSVTIGDEQLAAPGLAGAQAWDMLNEQVIEQDTDGKFELSVPSWGVSVFMVGKANVLAPIKAQQAKLNSKDMSVPKYFLDRPHLNEYEWGTPVPPIGE